MKVSCRMPTIVNGFSICTCFAGFCLDDASPGADNFHAKLYSLGSGHRMGGPRYKPWTPHCVPLCVMLEVEIIVTECFSYSVLGPTLRDF